LPHIPGDSQLWLIGVTVATLAAKASIAYSLLYAIRIRIACTDCVLKNTRLFPASSATFLSKSSVRAGYLSCLADYKRRPPTEIACSGRVCGGICKRYTVAQCHPQKLCLVQAWPRGLSLLDTILMTRWLFIVESRSNSSPSPMIRHMHQ